nr:MAG TPA_asm: hypothetical protein [Caudoviricetes sp.]
MLTNCCIISVSAIIRSNYAVCQQMVYVLAVLALHDGNSGKSCRMPNTARIKHCYGVIAWGVEDCGEQQFRKRGSFDDYNRIWRNCFSTRYLDWSFSYEVQ